MNLINQFLNEKLLSFKSYMWSLISIKRCCRTFNCFKSFKSYFRFFSFLWQFFRDVLTGSQLKSLIFTRSYKRTNEQWNLTLKKTVQDIFKCSNRELEKIFIFNSYLQKFANYNNVHSKTDRHKILGIFKWHQNTIKFTYKIWLTQTDLFL